MMRGKESVKQCIEQVAGPWKLDLTLT